MLSPVRTLAGTALTVVVTSFLVAGPGSGSAPNAAELDASLAAVITGKILPSSSPLDSDGTSEVGDDGVTRTEGIHYTNTWETSDPRLSGRATLDGVWVRFPLEDLQIEAASHVLENDEGRWVGSSSALVNRSSLGENLDVAILRGEGAYEGLTAFVLMDWTSFPAKIEAAIFPGEMPATPAPLAE
jgi:hypothetical protein